MPKKDMRDRGAENQAKGVGKQVEGRVRGAVGSLTGNEKEQAKGKMQELGGKARKALGDVQNPPRDRT